MSIPIPVVAYNRELHHSVFKHNKHDATLMLSKSPTPVIFGHPLQKVIAPEYNWSPFYFFHSKKMNWILHISTSVFTEPSAIIHSAANKITRK